MTTVRPIVPPATIGMLGGGQLGKYAIVAANAMGYRTLMLDPDPSAPAGVVANEHLVAPYDDPASLRRLGMDCAVVTTEFENPPASALATLADATRVAPRPTAVGIAQDRVAEKAFLVDNGFPVGPHTVLADGEVRDAKPATTPATPLDELVADGAIVKTARLGYDGKGQRHVDSVEGVHAAWAELGGVTCVVEARLDLLTELSVLVARTADARQQVWPVAENTHVDGILDVSVAPAPVDDDLTDRAAGLAMAVADALDFVGVLAVEMFVVDDGGPRLLINELAPRPHNSGHWTLDACVTSQFEQQIRAVCGVGLADTSLTAPAVAMVNVLGDLWFPAATAGDGIGGGSAVTPSSPVEPEWAVVLDDPDATLHLYGKTEARPGRKMGHLTVTAATTDLAAARALDLRARARNC